MKKILTLLVLFPIIVFGQTNSENWTKVTEYKNPTLTSIPNPTIGQALQNVTYYDGLGRPIQQVAHKQSASGKDIVTPIEYDAFGRQTKDYLPFIPVGDSSLDIKTNQVQSFYSSNNITLTGNVNFETTDYPYSEKLFEASPLNKVLEQAAPGNEWSLNNLEKHTIRLDYQTNENQEVKRYRVTTTRNPSTKIYDITLIDNGFYDPNELYKTITKDENWIGGVDNTTQEFKDKEGKVVLKRTFNNGDTHDTYYVYDIYGNLTYVIPPKVTDPFDTNQMEDLCYQYKYDYRNRLAEKKLPGKQWEYIVYDKLDRVVMTGPAFNPFGGTQTGWMVTKYDAFNRVVYTAWKANQDISSDVRYEKQHNVDVNTSLNESVANNDVDNVTINYTNNVFPTTDLTLLTVNYYDNYTFPDAPTPTTSVLGQPVMSNVKGLPTASWVRVLDDASQQTFEKSYTLYDNKSRALFVNTDNYLTGSTSVSSSYNFQGQLLSKSTSHSRTNNSLRITTRETFDYTPQGRLLNHFHKVNGNPGELIAHNEYDELGKLISKNVGGQDASGATGLQKVDYTYNIRGWLKNINNIDDLSQGTDPRDLFAFKINYNEVENDISNNVSALYNGNITETFWKSNSDNIKRSYGYKYDDLNRLLDCYYQKSNLLTNSYNESMQYDKNGNIKKLNRTGVLDNEYMTVDIDNLEYKYSNNDTSNKLIQVIDHDANPNGFKDGTNQSFDYDYDANGNMISDFNKGIENITYNHLNLPTEMLFANGSRINYLYDATGRKVRKIVIDANLGTEETTDYMGGYQYLDGVLKFFPTPEGYVNATEKLGVDENETIFSYIYNYVDHLGNIRVSYTQDPITHVLKILEENHYYPFGLKHSNYNSGKKILAVDAEPISEDFGKMKVKPVVITDKLAFNLKYNGKELQNELGLNLYDYGARNYDPALGRWMNMDPKAEKYESISPYTYVANNPIVSIDPDGKEIIFIVRGENGGKDQSLTYRKGNFYHNDTNKRYNPGKESLSPTLYKVLSVYRKIEKSDNDKMKTVLHQLENSKLKHFVEDGVKAGQKNNVTDYGLPSSSNKDAPVGTRTYYDFSEESKKDFESTEGVYNSDEAIVTHEMRHQYDYDIGNMSDDNNQVNDENDPSEIRAVFFENLMRKTLKQLERKKYGNPINPQALKDPPNNVFR